MNQRSLRSHAWIGLLLVACSTTTTNQVNSSDDDTGQGGGVGTTQATEDLGGSSGVGGAGGVGAAVSETSTATGGSVATTAVSKDLSCSSYCTLVQNNCLAENVKQYKSTESCLSSCAAFLLGSLNDTSGNTLGCRAHYALLAATDTTQCAAAGPSGGARCGSNCDAYCALMERVCPTVFDDVSTCRVGCLKMAGVDETNYKYGGSGDNLQCRIYHATFGAEGFPEIHCPHASPVPQGPCL